MVQSQKQVPASLNDQSNGELLSQMAVKIASLHLLAEDGSPLLRANILEAIAHLNGIYEKLLDDPRVMENVGGSFIDQLRRECTQKGPPE